MTYQEILSYPKRLSARRLAIVLLVITAFVAGNGKLWAQTLEHGNRVEAVTNIRIMLLCERNDSIDAIVSLLRRQIEQRCEAQVRTFGQAKLNIELDIQEGIGKEGFRIEDGSGGAVRIVGNDIPGLVYGVGKFLRTSRYDQGGFTPGSWRGTSIPQRGVRGMYFATHFHNFYHDAPADELDRYVEDLILWGVNSIAVWYDMHHFKGFDDPRAVDLRNRIGRIAQVAGRLGADVSLVMIANEGYGNSPPHLRRDGSGLRTKCFATDICPSKPGGMEYTLSNADQLFNHFSDLNPAYVVIWPYDSGGCSCPLCQPWVTNGYPKAASQLAQLAKEKYPDTKTVLASWAFTPDEWTALDKALTTKPEDWEWVDSLLATLYVEAGGKARLHKCWDKWLLLDITQDAGRTLNGRWIPGDRPLLTFARLGTHDMWPWGAFGANPTPDGCQSAWNAVKHKSHGGWPYSEGISDDINKVIFTQFHWSPDRDASEILREYVAYEFSPNVTDEICEVIKTLEHNHRILRWENGMLIDRITVTSTQPAKPVARDPATEATWEIVQQVDNKLTTYARNSWRWRILYLRALLDSELRKNGGKANEQCKEAFRELTEIYYAQKAERAAKLPTP